MLRPVRMNLVNVLLLKEDLPEAARALTEAACLEVEMPKIQDGRESLKRIDTQAAVAELASLRGRIEAVAESLEVSTTSRQSISLSDLRIAPRRIRVMVEGECSDIERKVRSISLDIRKGREAVSRVDTTAWVVAALEQGNIDPIVVMGPVYIGAQIGTIPSEILPHTRRSMEPAGHRLYSLGTLGARTFVCAVTTPERLGDMTSGLKNARFDPTLIRKDLVKEGHFDAQAVEIEMWETRERLTDNSLALARLAKESGADIRRWLAEIDLNTRILEAMGSFLEGEYTCLITGWVPVDNLAFLTKRIAERCEHPVELTSVDEETVAIEKSGTLLVPTKLANPGFLRPFEMIINLYGTPAYNAINPTPFVAFTFVLIFGAMFGDVGHGLVLALAGAALWFVAAKKSGMRDLGAVLGACGLGATVFGFLYGSVFGLEKLTPVWVRPMADPAGFLFYGVILGAVIINIGLVINAVQRFWARSYKEAFFGEWGISTLLFYWGAIFLFYMVTAGYGDYISWGVVTAVLVPPLFATAFGARIVDRIAGRPFEGDITDAVFKPAELMLASFTNTISFVRVPAFALNHAALMGAVLLMAGLMEGETAAAMFASKVDIVVGNILVIALEGLIVFVQTMRLHYYEFFSKFFHHQGRKFEPLAFSDGRR
ncbi:MAG: hypothetical protein J7M19_00935 [Planctomycetes bacterium]|nr:hypothetical protein [Planctomycetota bacterium]